TVVVALGLHREQTEIELEALVGAAVYERVRVVNHDPEDVVRLGVTTHGTPVELFRPLVEADVRVCLGNLEFHYFAGFSGGAKSILPGCASKITITANHGLMTQPGAATGRLTGNPVREDLEEGVAMLGVDFILNAIVDDHHRIVAAFAGDVLEAHRRGCELVADRGAVSISQRADIVLVSAGGYPLDVNMYQAQKALDNAVHAVREGGVIVWVAECREGLGSETFASWLQEADSADGILERIGREFVLGGHKAAAIAAVLKKARVHFVSSLPTDVLGRVGLVPFDNLDQALAAAHAIVGANGQVLALPYGDSVLPQVVA
ncbi:MAG: nickel-dependent lactate racemase, partial [Candidatus Latescibacterota bacterium]|nr:nickel-dependent lactate racemase [Candidatus Latescibacterota bacterium]